MNGMGLLPALIVLFVSSSAFAEVTAVDEGGFVSEHVLVLQAPPADVYRALTREVSAWWDGDHSWSGEAANFSMDARAGGCFCETLPDGGSVEHMRVVFAQPGRLLRLRGGLGPLQGMAVGGAMDFRLEDDGNGGTRLAYRYSVAGFAPGGLEALAGPVDQVQRGQLDRLAAYLAR